MDPQNPFRTAESHHADHDDAQEVIAERAIADAGQSQAMYNYNQKLLEQKERELMETRIRTRGWMSIAKNYGRIREVERELGNLQLQLKLTSGPKKHALELLRKKIETQNEKVAYVRAKHTAAKATYERLDAELKQEEAAKEQLCGELNTLVQQAAKAQLDKLEELKTTLEGLYSGVMPKLTAPAAAAQQNQQQQQGTPAGGQAGPSGAGLQQQQPQQTEAGTSGTAAGAVNGQAAATPASVDADAAAAAEQERLRQEQERQEQERQEQERQEQERRAAEERRRREAEAAAARSRHVSLGSTSGNPGGAAPGTRPSGGSAAAAAAGAAGPTGRQPGQAAAGPGGAAAARPKPQNGGAAAPAPAAGALAPTGPAQKQRFAGFDT